MRNIRQLISNPKRFRLSSLFAILLMAFGIFASAFAQDDPRDILLKCYTRCMNLEGGRFTQDISKKNYTEASPVTSSSTCDFLRVQGDSSAPYKFLLSMNNGDRTLCTSNDLVQWNAAGNTGIIYSRSSNQSIYRGAYQTEGLFPPFFQPSVVFSLDRLDQTTFIVRKGKDETAMGKSCYNIKLIDLIRASLPDGQRQEKTFLIDKQTLLPVFYSEKSVLRLNNDTVSKETVFRLTDYSDTAPHDSLFTFKSIPSGIVLRNMVEHVYHHHLKPGMKAPDFKGKLMHGDSVSLSAFRGKQVVLFFFHRTSYPSLRALQAMQDFRGANDNVEVLLIAPDSGEEELDALLKKRNISLKAIADAQAIADDYFITASPSFVVINSDGTIRKILKGYGEGTESTLLD